MAAKPTAELVREVLAHLNDRAYLAAHPSLAALGGPERLLPATQLRDAVVEAIEQLRPMGPPAPQSPAWRRHRNLVLRHLEGQSVEQVARALGVSVRQAIRDHREAVEALAVLLQSALGAGEGRTDEARPAGRPPEENGQPQPSPEMAGVAGGEKAADLVEVLGGVLPVIEEMARSRRVSFSTQDLDTLPTVAVNPTLLRQAMLHLLAYAAEVAPGRELLVVGADTPGGVILRVLPRPGVPDRARRPDAGSPRPASAPEELVGAARRMLEAQGCSVDLGTRDGPLLTCVMPPMTLPTVLVIDDNPDVVALFRRYLRDQPYRLLHAGSGASAVRLAVEVRPDLITLDVLLPSQDGWDILRQLRSHPDARDIPVIVCSVLPERALAQSLGVAGFLPKPVSRPALVAALERWCPAPGGPARS